MTTTLITAANRGIGLEFARQYSNAGHRVLVTARPGADTSELETLDVRLERLDVADAASVRDFAGRIGDEPIDLLINNAGYYANRAAFEELDIESLIDSFHTNSLGAMRVTQALLPNLRRGEGKRIVQITSKMGSMADNGSGGSYAYRMSKAALNMFNTSLAIDLAPEGFLCVILHPGWVQTRMGGESAPVAVEDSIAGMRRVIEELTPQTSGRFFDYSGAEIGF